MSSSRGFFIGQLIDDLAAISYQVENRCRFGFTDLNRMLEDFFRDVLNVVQGGHLRNLNETRSNEPGLDLGDETAGTAFQITSIANASKVHKTLEKITAEQAVKFTKIRILVIGAKQGSYTLDPTICGKFNFTEADIWDTHDLSRLALSLSAPDLQRLHRLVADEVARVKIELEMPAPNGEFPTSVKDYIEAIGKPTPTDGSIFYASPATEGLIASVDEAKVMLHEFAAELAKLPRLSREFLAFLISRSEARQSYGGHAIHVNADLVDRISRYPDTDGELRFLADRGFISFYEPEEPGRSPYWRIYIPSAKGDFFDAFFYFVEEIGLDLERVLVALDFSAFGPPPAAH